MFVWVCDGAEKEAVLKGTKRGRKEMNQYWEKGCNEISKAQLPVDIYTKL